MCGERSSSASSAARRSGSSPRVWGTPGQQHGVPSFHRFIPACVGNARKPRSARFAKPVHPRVCGERRAIARFGAYRFGSSPRVWGTHPHGCFHVAAFRFIPACVGNAASVSAVFCALTVHPRVCGERLNSGSTIVSKSGSSPRVWGTPQTDAATPPAIRFIPACVGNAEAQLHHLQAIAGSSPRVWGTHGLRKRGYARLRFIPACVGNAANASDRESKETVHPRVCGERFNSDGCRVECPGSSPRVWGTRGGRLFAAGRARFIPACVGNAPCHGMGGANRGGSSPRVWGTPGRVSTRI